jgi:hypothetical protein
MDEEIDDAEKVPKTKRIKSVFEVILMSADNEQDRPF